MKNIRQDTDFIGFTLNGIHSSQLGIVRISSSDRYTENLSGQIKNNAIDVPGGDGQYFFSQNFSTITFQIDFAFDSVTDLELRQMRQIFGSKEPQVLIFDETPYKCYNVVPAQPVQLKYLCFNNEQNPLLRLYKGEGSAQLISYYPYGLSSETFIVEREQTDDLEYLICNDGDLPMPVKIYFPANTPIVELSLDGKKVFTMQDIQYKNNDILIDIRNDAYLNQNYTAPDGTSHQRYNPTTETLSLNVPFNKDMSIGIKSITQKVQDSYFCIDMKTNLINGVDEDFNVTNNTYNEFITSGDFFTIPTGFHTLKCELFNFSRLEYRYIYN